MTEATGPLPGGDAGRRFDGRVALVSGGSSGIGRAIALALGEAGARVAVVARNRTPREGGVPTDEILRARGADATFIAADVADAQAATQAVGRAVEALGGLDILVTSAGVVEPTGESRDVDPQEFERHLAVNVGGTFFLAQAALRRFVSQRNGKIVTVASNFGLVGVPGYTAYCAAKAAVIGMTKALAAEYGEYGININVLCPGATATSINSEARSEADVQDVWRRMTPLRMENEAYIATPEDIAEAALFLASDQARFVTGTPLVVDGGWIAQ